MNISGKSAIITGGASGLGRATVEVLVKKGAKVAIFDLNDENGNALADQLGPNVSYYNVDVASEESVQAGIASAMKFLGELHICCNYAGIGNGIKTFGKKGPFPLEAFNKVIQVNLIGTFNVARLAAEQMAKSEPYSQDGARGVIINTASAAAFDGQMGQAAYSASKAAVVGMSLPIARDLASLGIRCNSIAPGLIATPLLTGGPKELPPETQAIVDSLGKQVLFPTRLGSAEEIAQIAISIIENDYINAECIRADGGMRMAAK